MSLLQFSFLNIRPNGTDKKIKNKRIIHLTAGDIQWILVFMDKFKKRENIIKMVHI